MTELGQTTDARALVPGDPSALADLVWKLRAYGESLDTAGQGLRRIDTEAGWSGEAADAFHERYRAQPKRWLDAADAFSDAAGAVDTYASTLQWAQGRASEAIDLWARGEQQTVDARAAHDAQVRDHDARRRAAEQSGGPVPPPVPAFQDTGEATRQAARDLLADARAQVRSAGDTAERVVARAPARAPPEPGLWGPVGAPIGDAAEWVGNGLQDVGIAVVNGLASFGNAMVHHPGDAALLLGGLLLMGVSGVGEGGGLALDATGVGAVVGVPLNVVAAAGIVAGAGMAAAGAGSLAQHAAGDSRVEVLEQRASQPSSPGSQGRSGTKTDRMKEHLTDRDLDAARRELNGEVVARKPDGRPWDHVGEVRDAQRGLINRIEQLKRQLGDSRLSDQARQAAQDELSEASRLLDYSRQFVPPQ